MKKVLKGVVVMLFMFAVIFSCKLTAAAGGGKDRQTATEIAYGTTYYDALSGRDADYYRFTVSDSGTYNFTGSTSISENAEVTFYYSNGYDIGSGIRPTWNTGTRSGKWDINLTLSRGTYYFRIYKYNGSGTYSFRIVETSSAYETFADTSGDTHKISTAHEMSIGKNVNGALACGEDRDWFRFSVTDSGIYNFTGDTNIAYSVEFGLFDGDGNEILSQKPVWDNTTSSGKWDKDMALSCGTYYLRIYEYNDKGFYEFRISQKASADETFRDNLGDAHKTTTAHQISLDQVVNGMIAYKEDRDFYKFSANAEGNYNFSGTTSISENAYFTVYNSDGNEVAEYKPVWNNETHKGTWNFDRNLKPGTYYVRIYEYNDKGMYSFSVKYTGKNTESVSDSMKRPSLKKLKAGKKNINVKWNKIYSSITGYQIQYSTDGKFFNDIKTINVKKTAVSKNIKKLKRHRKYYVRIRTYTRQGNVYTYSKWSKAKSVKTK